MEKNNGVARLKQWIAFGVLLIPWVFVFVGNPAQLRAQESSSQAYETKAREELEKFLNDMISLIQETNNSVSGEEREKRLHDRAMENFDFSTFSQLSLGRKYRSFSKKQQEEFILYFSRLISKTYVSRLEGQNVDNIQIQYDETRSLKPRENLLRVDASTRLIHSDVSIPIIYRLIKRDGTDWKIYDVQIEGVSMAANYRDQFRQAVSDSPEKIINDLKEKLKE